MSFRLDDNAKKILGRETLEPEHKTNNYTVEKRKKLIYDYIMDNPDEIISNKRLAEVAGYDMSETSSTSYISGQQFIYKLLKQGLLTKRETRPRDPDPTWYVNDNDYLSEKTEITKYEERVESEKIRYSGKIGLQLAKTAEKEEDWGYSNFVNLEFKDATAEELVEKLEKVMEVLNV